MKITLVTVGTLKEDYLSAGVKEYAKRIGAYAKWEEVNLKEEKMAEETPAAIHAALEREGDKILAALPKDAYRIALCVEGKQYSSEELASLFGGIEDSPGKVALVIGSSWGLSERVKAACQLRLSVSRMTFPHQLMRLILLEGIYRSLTILAGKKYHK